MTLERVYRLWDEFIDFGTSLSSLKRVYRLWSEFIILELSLSPLKLVYHPWSEFAASETNFPTLKLLLQSKANLRHLKWVYPFKCYCLTLHNFEMSFRRISRFKWSGYVFFEDPCTHRCPTIRATLYLW